MVETHSRDLNMVGMTAKPKNRDEPLVKPPAPKPADPSAAQPGNAPGNPPARPREIGGPKGPEPTRYGDWEVGGRCTDF